MSIQANTPTYGATGKKSDSWATVTNGTVYAAVRPLRGFEQLSGGQPMGSVTHLFTMRYRSDLAPNVKHRLSYNSRLFDVVSVVDVAEAHRFTEIMAREVV